MKKFHFSPVIGSALTIIPLNVGPNFKSITLINLFISILRALATKEAGSERTACSFLRSDPGEYVQRFLMQSYYREDEPTETDKLLCGTRLPATKLVHTLFNYAEKVSHLFIVDALEGTAKITPPIEAIHIFMALGWMKDKRWKRNISELLGITHFGIDKAFRALIRNKMILTTFDNLNVSYRNASAFEELILHHKWEELDSYCRIMQIKAGVRQEILPQLFKDPDFSFNSIEDLIKDLSTQRRALEAFFNIFSIDSVEYRQLYRP
ncbi:MAG: hypothetical protein V4686_00570 [Patescibacteria group bacterium]